MLSVPLHHLHLDHDLFALPPWVFGCISFVHDHTPNILKLTPCYIQWVFVGYSHTQKAITSIFQMSTSILSLMISHSLSLIAISPPPPHPLHLYHHIHPLYLPHPLHPLQRTYLIYLVWWILLLSYHYLHHNLLPHYMTLMLLHCLCHPRHFYFWFILKSICFLPLSPQPHA